MTAPAQSLEELAERAYAVAADAMRVPPLDLVRMMLNEAGVPKARTHLRHCLLALAEKQMSLRAALEMERSAKEALDAATIAAEWELDGCFVAEGNKTFLEWTPDPHYPDAKSRKAMTADERAKWKTTEARKMPDVAEAAKRLRSAEHDVAGRRDELVIAEKSLSAARADLDAGIAHLNALALALPSRNGDTR